MWIPCFKYLTWGESRDAEEAKSSTPPTPVVNIIRNVKEVMEKKEEDEQTGINEEIRGKKGEHERGR